MALRTAIKAALLSSEPQPPQPLAGESGPLTKMRAKAPVPIIIVEPKTEPQPLPAEAAPSAQEAQDTAWSAASLRDRAVQIRRLAATLPQKPTRKVINKIARLYDELARDAARAEKAAPAVTEAPAEVAPPAPPHARPRRPARPAVCPRRPLPSNRHRALRR